MHDVPEMHTSHMFMACIFQILHASCSLRLDQISACLLLIEDRSLRVELYHAAQNDADKRVSHALFEVVHYVFFLQHVP